MPTSDYLLPFFATDEEPERSKLPQSPVVTNSLVMNDQWYPALAAELRSFTVKDEIHKSVDDNISYLKKMERLQHKSLGKNPPPPLVMCFSHDRGFILFVMTHVSLCDILDANPDLEKSKLVVFVGYRRTPEDDPILFWDAELVLNGTKELRFLSLKVLVSQSHTTCARVCGDAKFCMTRCTVAGRHHHKGIVVISASDRAVVTLRSVDFHIVDTAVLCEKDAEAVSFTAVDSNFGSGLEYLLLCAGAVLATRCGQRCSFVLRACMVTGTYASALAFGPCSVIIDDCFIFSVAGGNERVRGAVIELFGADDDGGEKQPPPVRISSSVVSFYPPNDPVPTTTTATTTTTTNALRFRVNQFVVAGFGTGIILHGCRLFHPAASCLFLVDTALEMRGCIMDEDFGLATSRIKRFVPRATTVFSVFNTQPVTRDAPTLPWFRCLTSTWAMAPEEEPVFKVGDPCVKVMTADEVRSLWTEQGCALCGAARPFREPAPCRRCAYDVYCSDDCRSLDWNRHRFSCNMKLRVTAEASSSSSSSSPPPPPPPPPLLLLVPKDNDKGESEGDDEMPELESIAGI